MNLKTYIYFAIEKKKQAKLAHKHIQKSTQQNEKASICTKRTNLLRKKER